MIYIYNINLLIEPHSICFIAPDIIKHRSSEDLGIIRFLKKKKNKNFIYWDELYDYYNYSNLKPCYNFVILYWNLMEFIIPFRF